MGALVVRLGSGDRAAPSGGHDHAELNGGEGGRVTVRQAPPAPPRGACCHTVDGEFIVVLASRRQRRCRQATSPRAPCVGQRYAVAFEAFCLRPHPTCGRPGLPIAGVSVQQACDLVGKSIGIARGQAPAGQALLGPRWSSRSAVHARSRRSSRRVGRSEACWPRSRGAWCIFARPRSEGLLLVASFRLLPPAAQPRALAPGSPSPVTSRGGPSCSARRAGAGRDRLRSPESGSPARLLLGFVASRGGPRSSSSLYRRASWVPT